MDFYQEVKVLSTNHLGGTFKVLGAKCEIFRFLENLKPEKEGISGQNCLFTSYLRDNLDERLIINHSAL
jgi:hypothetical protein